MTANRLHLIRTLESMENIDDRYHQIRCVNYDPSNDETRGCFSLVFSAHDQLLNRTVALKFFDVHPSNLQNRYRIAAFEREPEILQILVGQKRCLQLVADMDVFNLEVKDHSGNILVTLPCSYFAVDWVADEIDHFFERQDEISTLDKLHLFNEIVLAVEALHRHEIHHRDLKPDNLRSYRDALRRIVVAIDLGTAARCSSTSLKEEYERSVGAPLYAPPEALLGFSGERRIAHLADYYALGCLLWELFNPGLFGRIVRNNSTHDAVTSAIAISLAASSKADKLESLRDALNRFSHTVASPLASGLGSSVPPSITRLLDDLVTELTSFDYRKRGQTLERVRNRIWSAIHCLQNEAWQRLTNDRRRQYRDRRLEKLRLKEQRLATYLSRPESHVCLT